MLTVDLVTARRRGKKLCLTALEGSQRQRSERIAQVYLTIVEQCVGRRRSFIEKRFEEVKVELKDQRIAAGIKKLIVDACQFEESDGSEAERLRHDLFLLAAEARMARPNDCRFERMDVLSKYATDRGKSTDMVERAMYADLRGEQRLLNPAPLTSQAVLSRYDIALPQAVLLRASKIVIAMKSSRPAIFRDIFRKIKFLGLIARIVPRRDGAYQITIDGPTSLFRSVTKYGMQLALLLPWVVACDEWAIEAEVQWGKQRVHCRFRLDKQSYGTFSRPPSGSVCISEDILQLQQQFDRASTRWRAQQNGQILHVPGVGVCVPDLVFTQRKDDKKRVFFERMGFWSRQGLWRRIDLVNSGLKDKLLIAASDKLRVSEEALPKEKPAMLYVYKSSLSWRVVERYLDQISML